METVEKIKENRKRKISRILFILNSFLFLISGIDLLTNNKLIFASLQIFAAMLNLSMIVEFKHKQINKKIELLVLVMNIIICIFMAFDYIQSGKSYIQYIWMFAAIMSAIALLIQLQKNKMP